MEINEPVPGPSAWILPVGIVFKNDGDSGMHSCTGWAIKAIQRKLPFTDF